MATKQDALEDRVDALAAELAEARQTMASLAVALADGHALRQAPALAHLFPSSSDNNAPELATSGGPTE